MMLPIFSNRYHNNIHLMNGTTNTLQEAFLNITYLPTPRLQKPGDNPKNFQSGSHFY